MLIVFYVFVGIHGSIVFEAVKVLEMVKLANRIPVEARQPKKLIL
ncbi:hypothetical protein C900_00755 [Fulvivirga imtechensis AK7]|uniref:Uncharacterized protein n=1 Tax=Fulvivirga imtechensis AK7 TaxID=1237149 RepID=L8JYT3_9BACT|nr:hypothetical protein C900_00755 [Fulvivirga imtechensis AK7]